MTFFPNFGIFELQKNLTVPHVFRFFLFPPFHCSSVLMGFIPLFGRLFIQNRPLKPNLPPPTQFPPCEIRNKWYFLNNSCLYYWPTFDWGLHKPQGKYQGWWMLPHVPPERKLFFVCFIGSEPVLCLARGFHFFFLSIFSGDVNSCLMGVETPLIKSCKS